MPDELSTAADVVREMIWTAVKIAAPILLVGLAVGLLAAFLQALTNIAESSLTFVPKLLATAAAALLLLPWMLAVLAEYTLGVFGSMAAWFP